MHMQKWEKRGRIRALSAKASRHWQQATEELLAIRKSFFITAKQLNKIIADSISENDLQTIASKAQSIVNSCKSCLQIRKITTFRVSLACRGLQRELSWIKLWGRPSQRVALLITSGLAHSMVTGRIQVAQAKLLYHFLSNEMSWKRISGRGSWRSKTTRNLWNCNTKASSRGGMTSSLRNMSNSKTRLRKAKACKNTMWSIQLREMNTSSPPLIIHRGWAKMSQTWQAINGSTRARDHRSIRSLTQQDVYHLVEQRSTWRVHSIWSVEQAR